MDLERYWQAVLRQVRETLRGFFHPDAWVNWHNTGERFTVEEFIRANCEYPGEWEGELERVEKTGSLIITAAHVFSREQGLSFHVTSFLREREGKIAALDEYWGDDGPPPKWRQEKKLGRPIPREGAPG